MASLMVFDFETGRDIFFRRARGASARERRRFHSRFLSYTYTCIYILSSFVYECDLTHPLLMY